MRAGFHATQFSSATDAGVLVTVLGAPSTEEEDFYLMLQLSLEPSEQDVRLGMAMPYIEYCGQGRSWYGHIEAFTLYRDRVLVVMDDEAAEEMRGVRELDVTFNLAPTDLERLQVALRTTFRRQSYYRESV